MIDRAEHADAAQRKVKFGAMPTATHDTPVPIKKIAIMLRRLQ